MYMCTMYEFHNFSFHRSDEQVCYMYLYLWLCFILFSKCIFTCISCICIPVCVPYKMLFEQEEEDHPRMDGAGFNLQPCLGFWVDFSALASQSRISQSKAPTTGQPILSVRTPFGPLPASEKWTQVTSHLIKGYQVKLKKSSGTFIYTNTDSNTKCM